MHALGGEELGAARFRLTLSTPMTFVLRQDGRADLADSDSPAAAAHRRTAGRHPVSDQEQRLACTLRPSRRCPRRPGRGSSSSGWPPEYSSCRRDRANGDFGVAFKEQDGIRRSAAVTETTCSSALTEQAFRGRGCFRGRTRARSARLSSRTRWFFSAKRSARLFIAIDASAASTSRKSISRVVYVAPECFGPSAIAPKTPSETLSGRSTRTCRSGRCPHSRGDPSRLIDNDEGSDLCCFKQRSGRLGIELAAAGDNVCPAVCTEDDGSEDETHVIRNEPR